MFELEDVKEEAYEKAREFRINNELGIRGIENVFAFIEKTLGYLLIRYPFGKDSIQGFSTVYNTDRLIVTNSSERLSRERFTAAHELGHHLFDIHDDNPELIYDQRTGNFDEHNLREYRADCFAAAFLMPEEGLKKAIKETGKKPEELYYDDLIQLQSEFGVSHKAMVKRLFQLNIISVEKAQILYSYYESTSTSLKGLFLRYNADPELLEPYNEIQIPVKFIKYLQSNYDADYISYSTLKKVLAKIDKEPNELGFEETIQAEDDTEINIDDILGELND